MIFYFHTKCSVCRFFPGNDFQQLELNGRIALPVVNIVFFQSGLIEKTIQSTSLQDSLSHLARSSVALMHWKESTLTFSKETRTKVAVVSFEIFCAFTKLAE